MELNQESTFIQMKWFDKQGAQQPARILLT
jgi:hypothetical protein